MPEGVELADAREVLPEDRIVRYASGSYSLFSNRFRYELQRQGRGTWVDCDVYLLSPLDGERPSLFGEEQPGVIGTGVLRLPAGSPLLPPLIELFEERQVPRWLGWRDRLAARWRRARTGRVGLERMPWGTAGPRAVTALARHHGLSGQALPPDVFCPAPWQAAEWICNPSDRLEDRVTERTVAVHLWNERIKHLKDKPAAAGSFLARLQEEGR